MTELLKISLPDGSVREVPVGSTPADIAAAIGPGLAKAALAARVDHGSGAELRDLNRPFEGDAELALVTSRDEAEALELARHDYAHVLAEAVQALWPGTQITFGPATDDGFYYDVKAPDSREPFSMDDLPAIEDKMREIIRADKPLRREVWSREDLIAKWSSEGEIFKAEWAKELPENEELTVYWSGNDWLDMCRGPHLPSTGKLDPDAFKLMRVAGAYWRGDQRNAQLTRIYGTGWLNKKQLNAHLTRLEEAAKRDHRKLGREMDLSTCRKRRTAACSGTPRATGIWRELELTCAADGRRRLPRDQDPAGDGRAPVGQSGHVGARYRRNMFVIPDEVPNTEDGAELVSKDAEWMALKPMNCPAHVLVFKQGITSYRDLPIRLGEMGCCHRNEPHGALHGLMRVRQFTQDDAHIFCTEAQVVSEVQAFIALADSVYRDFGFTYDIKLALRPEQRFGSDADWDKAEQELRDALTANGLEWEELPGEGAFYAPKLEWHLTDAIGRTWQVGTIQSDRVLPERLDAHYIGEDGEKHRPVMLHRAIFGSYERFIGILIEHFAGRLPAWLAPVQAVVATIVSDADGYANDVEAQLKAAGIRVETDTRNEKINYKVREHSLAKVPHLLVVGKREAEEGTVAVRTLGAEHQKVMPLADAIAMLRAEGTPPDLVAN
jgi:threonyl-tRNA synthetase